MDVHKQIQQHAKRNCCNFHHEDRCYIEPGGNTTCVFFRPNGEKALCPWFEEAVLPMDADLERTYWARRNAVDSDSPNSGTCVKCNKPITKNSNRQQYCESCSAIAKRESTKLSARKRRSSTDATA
ncbi:cysteine-rich VLP protein [Alicyclobacillus cycloheptanicus]|nr:cysteine-rich VLP protein [Alicyclobacillus cycloheptanicus]